MQPPWHLRSAVQVGVAVGQSPLVTHWTHSPRLRAQMGAVLAQWPLSTHDTHTLRSGSQSGRSVPAQSALEMQRTQAPLDGSHCVPCSQVTELPGPHAAWQAWSVGEQARIEAGQSLLLAQTEQVPRTHFGLAVGQPSSLEHSTQPSVASQSKGDRQPAAQRPPVSAALDGAGSSPPQASGTRMNAAASAANERGERRIMAESPEERRVGAMQSEEAVLGPLFGTSEPAPTTKIRAGE